MPVDRVVDLTQRLLDLGVYEVAVSDTIGIAHPGQVRRVLDRLVGAIAPANVALHFHDTRGTALANVLASLDYGITTFDASAGGLGGCPYAPGASGNLATEDLLYLLSRPRARDRRRISTLVTAASAPLEAAVGHPLPSRYVQASRASRASTST